MEIGYARKSTTDQKMDLQIDALKHAGCMRIFSDSASGGRNDRAGLQEALESLRAGDTLVIWRLDRLSRSLGHLISTVNELNQREVGLRSLTEQISTTTPGGKLIFHIFGALAEFEKGVIRERTKAGLESARARGRIGGRPEKMDDRKTSTARRLMADPALTTADICATMQVSKSTLYRHLAKINTKAMDRPNAT